MKSSNDGPLSRVEANEVLVGAEAGAAVASERMAVLQDRWDRNREMVKDVMIPLKNHTRDAAGTRPATKQDPGSLGGGIG